MGLGGGGPVQTSGTAEPLWPSRKLLLPAGPQQRVAAAPLWLAAAGGRRGGLLGDPSVAPLPPSLLSPQLAVQLIPGGVISGCPQPPRPFLIGEQRAASALIILTEESHCADMDPPAPPPRETLCLSGSSE